MTIVLVHGNPETAAIWDPLRGALGRDDVVALSPPGFGAPVPDGFAAQWMLQDPNRGAAALAAFWSSMP